MPDELLQRLRQRDRLALSRLLTLIQRGENIAGLRDALRRKRDMRVVAITGSAGVGKSTLIGRMIDWLRDKGQRVAVLACDPQSPLTGGALLGDRIRMPSRPDDAGLFIRSLTAAGGREAVAEHLDLMLAALNEFGFDVVFIETAGAGQTDTAVRSLTDVVVLLVQPEAGDDLQWQKAGLLEIADVVVIHKADLPAAERVEAQVRGLLNLPGCREVPVLRVSAAQSTGFDELWTAITAIPAHASPERNESELLRLAQERLAEKFRERSNRMLTVVEHWRDGELPDVQAADAVLRLLSSD